MTHIPAENPENKASRHRHAGLPPQPLGPWSPGQGNL